MVGVQSKGASRLWKLFLVGAELTPDGLAVSTGSGDCTYAELRELAEALAASIARSIEPTPSVVALHLDRNLALYVSYLAAARLGATVVPIPVGTARARWASIDRAVGPALLITGSGRQTDTPPAGWSSITVNPDGTAGAAGRHAPPPRSPERPGDLTAAYVMFTSGSTGRPKGVPVSGEAVGRYVHIAAALAQIRPGDRHSQYFSIGFDLSVHDLFVTWWSGGCVVPPQKPVHAIVGRYVTELGLTHWFSVPSGIALAQRAERQSAATANGLRWAGFCGEPLTVEQAEFFHVRFPDAELWNLYGPTELTIACSAHRFEPAVARPTNTHNGTVPIGIPFPHLEWQLDPPGERGELLVRGLQRFDGYLDPADNDGAFSPPPRGRPITAADWYRTGDVVERSLGGGLIHCGRLDTQVKIHGFRVELGEVEHALSQCPGVTQAIVVAREQQGVRVKALHAFYVGEELEHRQLRSSLEPLIPKYMIPEHLTRLDALPLNDNGKVDRRRLRELMREGPEQSAD